MVPVNYTIVDGAIVTRTTPYSILGTYGRNAVLAFAIDSIDRGRERGWSVQARGRGDVVEDHAELARIRDVGDPTPWAGSIRSMYIRLRWTELNGRKLGQHWNPLVNHETPNRSA